MRPGDDWLQKYFTVALNKKLCAKPGCSTCGSMEFRHGLLKEFARATEKQDLLELLLRVNSNQDMLKLERANAIAIAEALRYVVSGPIDAILFYIWNALGEVSAERDIEPIIKGTHAGSILANMQAHYKARQEAHRVRQEYESPISTQKRKEEKRQKQQEEHAKRLEKQKGKSRIWHEKHGDNNS